MIKLGWGFFSVAVAITFLLIGCDKGLDPETDTVAGIEGTVTIVDGWPETSEVREAYIVIFKTIPKDSIDAVSQFFAGNILFTELTPSFQNQYEFSIDLTPATYELTVCIGVRGDQFLNLASWVLAGVYSETNNILNPKAIVVTRGERVSGIHIDASVESPLPFTF